MGQTDLAVRLLAEHHMSALAPSLLEGRRVEVLAVERSELQLVERITDQVVRALVDGVETILHVEFQARHSADLPERVLAYHALLLHRHRPLPVVSVVVYLVPGPMAPPRGLRQGQVTFTYEVFCPWEHPIGIEQVRRCPALAPLAALTPGITAADLPALGRVIDEAPELTPAARLDLRALTYFIAGRRFPEDLLTFLVESKAMEESATYRYVMEKYRAEGREEGREEGRALGSTEQARQDVLEALEIRFEAVPATVRQSVLTVSDPGLLRELLREAIRTESVAAFEAALRQLTH